MGATKKLRFRKRYFFLGFVALWIWLSSDISLVSNHLEASAVVTGGEAKVIGIGWKEENYIEPDIFSDGLVWLAYPLGLPLASLDFSILIENTGEVDLEITDIEVVLSDPFGRESTNDWIKWNRPTRPYLIEAGESRPVGCNGGEFNYYPLIPLTWTQVEIRVSVMPAREWVKDRYRWRNITITESGYDEEGFFILEGEVLEDNSKKDDEWSEFHMVYVSFYNEAGDFIGYEKIFLNWHRRTFQERIDTSGIGNGPIDSFIVHYAEET